MKRVYFGHDGKGKLVRDNLPQVIANQGYPVKYHQLGGDDLAKKHCWQDARGSLRSNQRLKGW